MIRKLPISLLASILFSLTQMFGQSIVQVTRLPSTTYWDQAYGLAADSTRLFVSSGTSSAVYNRGFIYVLNDSVRAIDSIATGIQTYSQGLARSGSDFWYVRGSGSSGKIYRVTASGALVDSITPPSGWYLGGACWDGTGLWVSNYYPNNLNKLYKYNVTTKAIVDSIQSYGLQPQGIAWDGQYLYYVNDNNDGDAEKIYQVNMATRDTVRSWYLPEGPTSNMSPRGLAWDGRYLWLIAEPVGASSGRSLYKYDLGGGGTPDINLSSTLLDFGQVRIGQQRVLNVDIQNVGTAPLRVDSVRVFLSAHFVAALSTPVTIQPNSSVAMPVTFSPAQFGADSASILVYSNDPDEGTILLPSRGYGIYGSAIISAPSSYDFAARRVGSSTIWKMTVQNLGGDQLVISSVSVSNPVFWIDSVAYPVQLDSLARKTFRVWFDPLSPSTVVDTLRIVSNASNSPIVQVVLRGSGDATPIPIGQPLWTYNVPDHPISNTFRTMKGLRAIGDTSGTGKKDVIVCTENYWTMRLHGNASVTTDSLWGFSSFISSYSAGSIGTTGDYSYQKALAIAKDLNHDGHNDVVIGTGGGNERVYALDGWNGRILWSFGTDHPDSFGLGDITSVDASADFNGDGVPDVLAAAAATESGGIGPRQKVYLFNGPNGQLIWQAAIPGFTHGVTAIPDINGDGVPDAVGCTGEPGNKATAFNGVNGNVIWNYPVANGAKEVMVLPIQGQTPDVIVGGFFGPVARVDGETGAQVWSYPTGSRIVTRLDRLRDVTGDGVDEVIVSLQLAGVRCLNGANGQVVWSNPAIASSRAVSIAAVPDLNNDGFDDVVVALQDEGAMILRGQDGQQLAVYSFGTNECREVTIVPDMDGNNSYEILAGSKNGNLALLSGGTGLTSVGEMSEVPERFSVSQNYPNPFNPSTTIKVNLPEQSDISLIVYDVLGRRVKELAYERVPAGVHEILWDGNSSSGLPVASGVYFYRVTAREKTITQRMLLLK